VQAIAKAAGYTTGAIYSNFDGKDGLFLAVTERRQARLRTTLRDQVSRQACSVSDLVLIVGAVIAQIMSDPGWVAAYYEFLSYGVRDSNLRGRLAMQYRALTNDMTDLLTGTDGAGRGDVYRLAPVITALIEGSISVALADPNQNAVALFGDGLAMMGAMSSPSAPHGPVPLSVSRQKDYQIGGD
jgi:AcrR family transcriptional regulator